MATYHFPMLEAADIVSSLTSWQLNCKESDISKPSKDTWQHLFTSMLAFALGADENEMIHNFYQTQFEASHHLEYQQIHEEALPLNNLSRAMQRVLCSCGVEDFRSQDILEPKPRRLIRICSALINFINFRSDRIVVYDEIKSEDENLRHRRTELKEEIDDKLKENNAIKASRAQQEPHLQAIKESIQELTQKVDEKKSYAIQTNRETAIIKEQLAEKKANLSHVSEQVTAAKAEGKKLASQTVQSPERMKGEMERMQNDLALANQARTDKYGKLLSMESQLNSMNEQIDNNEQALNVMKLIFDQVQKEKDICMELNKIHARMAEADQQLREIETEEQGDKRRISAMQGKINKQQLQYQNKMADMADKLDRLKCEKGRLENERGEEESDIRGTLEAKEKLSRQDTEQSQEHKQQMDLLKAKYNELLKQVDTYHLNLGEKFTENV